MIFSGHDHLNVHFSSHLHIIFKLFPCHFHIILISFFCRESFIPFGATINEHNCNGPMARIVHFGKSKGEGFLHEFVIDLRSVCDRFGIDSISD